MEIIEDLRVFRPLVEEVIRRFGYAPEHNLEWFLVNAETNEKHIFISWPDGTGLMTLKAKKEWYTFSEPLVPMNLSGERVLEFARFALNNGTEEVIVEVGKNTRKQMMDRPIESLNVLPVDCTLIWPVVNLEKFPSDLSGGELKGLRNIRNRFYREYTIEIIDAQNSNKEELFQIVESWSKNRTGEDEVWPQTYLNLIDNDFASVNTTKVFIIDGITAGFVAGWEIPNKPGYFYNGVAIHDYSLKDMGLFMYTENVLATKGLGYKYFDLGGVEEGGPLDFKRRFLPEYEYKTFIFSITKR